MKFRRGDKVQLKASESERRGFKPTKVVSTIDMFFCHKNAVRLTRQIHGRTLWAVSCLAKVLEG